MQGRRVWVFGAPGSGVTTLGKALAARLDVPFYDTDDYYWFTDDPLPYRRKRNAQHRLHLLQADLDARAEYLVAGALLGWGESLVERFDFIVYRWLPANVRLERIRQREVARYGPARLAPGGDLSAVFDKFLSWAEQYDTAPPQRLRSRAAEEAWLAAQEGRPILRLTQDQPVTALVEVVLHALREHYR
jgi:adenylate kinase family enzyme